MASSDPRRPNILFILTDDQGYWALGCAGNKEMRTPQLDRIAAGGIRFENFFCASPVCSPARASILTGRIPSQHGVHDWIRVGNSTVETESGGKLIQYLKGQTAFTEVLVEQGYTCGLSGKWHLGDSHHPQKGFSFWFTHSGGGSPYRNAPMVRDGEAYREPRYVTDAITATGLDDTSTTSKLIFRSDDTGSGYKMTLADVSGSLLATLGIGDESVAAAWRC